MYSELLAQEHYRIHVMEQWPDGPRRDAGLAAARSALATLLRTPPVGASGFMCDICASRIEERRPRTVAVRPRFTRSLSMPKAA